LVRWFVGSLVRWFAGSFDVDFRMVGPLKVPPSITPPAGAVNDDVARMHMTDDEIRRAMAAIAAVNGRDMSPERIDRALPAYKSYLASIEVIRRVDLPLEAEPASMVIPRHDRRG
jgi:hypothetical protein